MLKVLELFSGIGACSKALTNLGIEHEIVDAVEIDKYAVQSFNAIHGTNFEPQDITKWDKDIRVNLIMHGSPCQDFSVAGKGAGGDKGSGTRSSLMYETLRIVEKLKPKYVIWENVKNLLSKKHRHNFDAYIEAMNRLGYVSKYQVLNAKDYGVPQNRERVFTVSILGGGDFEFPEKQELTVRLKDVLETEVNESYYLTDEQTKRLRNATFGSNNWQSRMQSKDGISKTLLARDYKDPKCVQVGQLYGTEREPRVYAENAPTLRADRQGLKVAIRTANKKGYDMAANGDGIDLAYPQSNTRRGRVGHGVSKTIATGDTMGTLTNDMRIRKLTPKECWRLMGFDDEDFEKAKEAGISNSQLYKQAGNSIVVNVLEGILRNLIKKGGTN